MTRNRFSQVVNFTAAAAVLSAVAAAAPAAHAGPDRACANPAVVTIRFRMIERLTPSKGKIRIFGVVHNRGTKNFVSRWGQQELHLYENSRLVKVKKFRRINAGQSIRVSHARTWNAAATRHAKGVPVYRAIIVYDPDIYMDSNPRNDDCVSGDNRLARNGREINRLFR